MMMSPNRGLLAASPGPLPGDEQHTYLGLAEVIKRSVVGMKEVFPRAVSLQILFHRTRMRESRAVYELKTQRVFDQIFERIIGTYGGYPIGIKVQKRVFVAENQTQEDFSDNAAAHGT